jgi:DNA-binding NtrC family response regulator
MIMEKKDFRILVVDDDEMVRDVIVSTLSQQGYPVISARDGFDAIGILMVEDIKLVITDLKMPGMDGIEVLESATKNNPDIAVVILTGFSTLETALKAIKKGAYDYLTKPFAMEEIIFVAERAFKREALIEENRELRNILRNTYRDMEVIRSVNGSANPEVRADWRERIERLKAIRVFTQNEARIIEERLFKDDV